MRLITMAAALFCASQNLSAAPPSRSSSPSREIELAPDFSTRAAELDQAISNLSQQHPAAALKSIEALISALEAKHRPNGEIVYYSARNPEEALLYGVSATLTGTQKVAVTDRNWSEAYFYKGYALVDLNREDEAIVWFDKALALSPRNSNFLNERADWFKRRGDWDNALKGFSNALDATDVSPADSKPAEMARALRGLAFVKVEQDDLKSARVYLEKALAAKPDDPRTKADMDDLEQREKR